MTSLLTARSRQLSRIKMAINKYFQRDDSYERYPRYIMKLFDEKTFSNVCRFYSDSDSDYLSFDIDKILGSCIRFM